MAGTMISERIPRPAVISVTQAWEHSGVRHGRGTALKPGFVEVRLNPVQAGLDPEYPTASHDVSLDAFRKVRREIDDGGAVKVVEHDGRGVWMFKVASEPRPPRDRRDEAGPFYRIAVKPERSIREMVTVSEEFDGKRGRVMCVEAPLLSKWSVVVSRDELSEFVDGVISSAEWGGK